MAQGLNALSALPEDPGSFPEPRYLLTIVCTSVHMEPTSHRHTHRQNTNAHKMQVNNLTNKELILLILYQMKTALLSINLTQRSVLYQTTQ